MCNLSNPSEHVQMDTKSTEQMNSEGIQTAGLDEVFPPIVHVFFLSDMCVCVLFGENCMTQAAFFKMYQAEFHEISTILRKYMSPIWIPHGFLEKIYVPYGFPIMDSPSWIPPWIP